MQRLALQQMSGETIGQRLQGHAGAAHPLSQRGTRKRDVFARSHLLQAVERQVVEVFAGDDPGQQAGGSHAAIDDGRI